MINEVNKKDTSKPGAPDIEDCWVRKALCHNKILVVAEDHTGNIIKENDEFCVKVGGKYLPSGLKSQSGSCPEIIHAVVHSEGGDKSHTTNDFFSRGCNGKTVIILHVSTMGSIPEYSDEEYITNNNEAKFIWLRAKDWFGGFSDDWLSEFLMVTAEEAEKLASCKSRMDVHGEIESKCPNFLDILFPGRVEDLSAYKLLKSAKSACGENDQCQNFNESGLILHVPQFLEDWWKVFDDDEAKGVKTLARCINDAGNGDEINLTQGLEQLKSAVGQNLGISTDN